jgi:hypothetical protein
MTVEPLKPGDAMCFCHDPDCAEHKYEKRVVATVEALAAKEARIEELESLFQRTHHVHADWVARGDRAESALAAKDAEIARAWTIAKEQEQRAIRLASGDTITQGIARLVDKHVAKAREEQREACALLIHESWPDFRRIVRSAPLDSTPLADELRAERSSVEQYKEILAQVEGSHDRWKARAEAAEALNEHYQSQRNEWEGKFVDAEARVKELEVSLEEANVSVLRQGGETRSLKAHVAALREGLETLSKMQHSPTSDTLSEIRLVERLLASENPGAGFVGPETVAKVKESVLAARAWAERGHGGLVVTEPLNAVLALLEGGKS